MTRETLEAFKDWLRAEVRSQLSYYGAVRNLPGSVTQEEEMRCWRLFVEAVEKEQKHDE